MGGVQPIEVNIWDEYADEGDSSETFAYVESDHDDVATRAALEVVADALRQVAPRPSVRTSFRRQAYQWLGGEMVTRTELVITGLPPRELRETLLPLLAASQLLVRGHPIAVISES